MAISWEKQTKTNSHNVDITWIFATFVPLDEAHYEKDQDEESDGTHQSNKPSLSCNVHLPAGYSWTHTHTQRKEGTDGDKV